MKRKGWLTNKESDYVFGLVPRLGIDLVIKDRRGVLLSYRLIEPAKRTWHTPGGRVRFGERIEQAVRRIAKAETGLEVRIDKLLGFMQFPVEKQNGRTRHTVTLVFQVRPVSGEPRPDENASAVKFFKKFPSSTYSVHRQFMEKAGVLV